ncbi:TetR/AcrR family transcriptional regulator [Vreelandella arcis]|uniref:Transcriptional regulator, TetR family n=1 Tax=Vreelandella arcis TaxID=416873 RepID=A0A1G9YRH6_9GAMM|nr:TetR/AcrR family transcriptional regulator [Halomonas arcis]SDN11670.1 transcriptional regulator, TetR family [Halomonas arcis]
MTGLRERQKADRNRRILTTAAKLFRRDDYRHVRIEDLAHQANVSVGTVYNYYATKGDILIAIVAMEVEEVLEAGECLLASPPQPALKALTRLIDHYYDHSLHYLNKQMWRTAMATSIDAPQTPNGLKYNLLDERLKDQVQRLILVLKERGDIAADLEAAVVGSLLFNVLNMLFMEFIKSDDMELESLKTQLHRQLEMIAQWLVP